jgi:peptide/nickel transport system permease protein
VRQGVRGAALEADARQGAKAGRRLRSAASHDLTRFLTRRIALAVPTLLGVSLVVFSMTKIVPGNAVDVLLGPRASPADRAALEERLGLSQPLPVQYWRWLTHAVRGDLGLSSGRFQPVWDLVRSAFANTLVLTLGAMVLALLIATGLALLGAVRGKVAPATADLLTTTAVSIPPYSAALMFIIYFGVERGWFPTQGMHTLGKSSISDLAWHLTLPALTAAMAPAGVMVRIFRAALTDVMGSDLMTSLRARGLSTARCTLHAIHNTVPSLLTIAGLQLGYLLGGVVFVEVIFSWPGIGNLVYQAISQRDLAVIQAGVLVGAVAFVTINIVVDGLRSAIDPRVRAA